MTGLDAFVTLKTSGSFSLRNVRLPACAAPVTGLPVVQDGLVAADLVI